LISFQLRIAYPESRTDPTGTTIGYRLQDTVNAAIGYVPTNRLIKYDLNLLITARVSHQFSASSSLQISTSAKLRSWSTQRGCAEC